MQDEGYTSKRQQEYREVYLRSDHWAEQRKMALDRAGHRCQTCNSGHKLDVHHRTYERLGSEHPSDLTVLCRRCHDLFHGNSKVAQPKRKRSGSKKKKRKSLPPPVVTKLDRLEQENAELHRRQQEAYARRVARRERERREALKREFTPFRPDVGGGFPMKKAA